MDMDMKMFYYFGHEDVQLFFEKWKIDSHSEMALACGIIFILTCTGEFIRLWKEHQLGKSLKSSVRVKMNEKRSHLF